MPTPRALRLLHPKWLLLHLFVVAVCVAMVLLGRWQWHVAHQHHGDIRYYAYAFQWWAFTGFALIMWARVVGDYLRTRPAGPAPVAEPPAERTYLAYVPPSAASDDEAADPERARFNAYLAELSASDESSRRPDGHRGPHRYELKGDA
ncbi:MAG TPA: hypothetical protein VMB79_09995 [Jatrophihabitans sp.]|nr:hypothetical protein [Jatrophihabitans sp.]